MSVSLAVTVIRDCRLENLNRLQLHAISIVLCIIVIFIPFLSKLFSPRLFLGCANFPK